jgi:hypothetical protein
MNTNPPDDFEETVLETFHEMETGAQITPMILAELPDEVIQAIEDYEITHSVDRDRLLELATIAHAGRIDLPCQACAHLIDTPESFTWPVKDPLLCVMIAFLREFTFRSADKICEKHGLGDDADEPADWWKSGRLI